MRYARSTFHVKRPIYNVSRETFQSLVRIMYAKIDSDMAASDIVWHINDALERDCITTDQIDVFLGTPEGDGLPNWVFDIINAISIHATDCKG